MIYAERSQHKAQGLQQNGHKTDVEFIDNMLMGIRYCEKILRCHIVLFIWRNGRVFQQDNSHPHVAHVCNIYIFDLRLLKKAIEPSVVHSSMNAMDHAKWCDVKTTDAFGDLIGRCYYCDDVAALKLTKYNLPALNAACNVKFSPRYARKMM